MIHLDTSFLIRALVPHSAEAQRLRRWIRAGEDIIVSAISWAEFLCGPLSALAIEEAAELLGEPAPFDGLDATLASELFNAGGRRRGTLLDCSGTLLDCMIASTAIRRGAQLATSNPRDFRRLTAFGLELV